MNYRTSLTVVAVASIDNVQQKFTSLGAAQVWLNDLQARIQWMEDIGLLALVNGRNPRWGRSGHEYLGWEREPGRGEPQSLNLTLQRACTYIGKWMCFPNVADTEYPIDLTGLIVDRREWRRYEIPAASLKNAIVSPAWQLREDGYYYRPDPDMMWPMDLKYWSPVYQVGGVQVGFVFADNAAMMEQ